MYKTLMRFDLKGLLAIFLSLAIGIPPGLAVEASSATGLSQIESLSGRGWWHELARREAERLSFEEDLQYSAQDLEDASQVVFRDFLKYIHEVGVLTAAAEFDLRMSRPEEDPAQKIYDDRQLCSKEDIKQWEEAATQALSGSQSTFVALYCYKPCINPDDFVTRRVDQSSCFEQARKLYDSYQCNDEVIPDSSLPNPIGSDIPSSSPGGRMDRVQPRPADEPPVWSPDIPVRPQPQIPGLEPPVHPERPAPKPVTRPFSRQPMADFQLERQNPRLPDPINRHPVRRPSNPIESSPDLNIESPTNIHQDRDQSPNLGAGLSHAGTDKVEAAVNKKLGKCKKATKKRSLIQWDPDFTSSIDLEGLVEDKNDLVSDPVHPDDRRNHDDQTEPQQEMAAQNCKLLPTFDESISDRLMSRYKRIRFTAILEHLGHYPLEDPNGAKHEIEIDGTTYEHPFDPYLLEQILASADRFFVDMIDSIDPVDGIYACASADDSNGGSGGERIGMSFVITAPAPDSQEEEDDEKDDEDDKAVPTQPAKPPEVTFSQLFRTAMSGAVNGATPGFGADPTGKDQPRVPPGYGDFYDGQMSEERLAELERVLAESSPQDLKKLQAVMRSGDAKAWASTVGEITGGMIGGGILGVATRAGVSIINAGKSFFGRIARKAPHFFSRTIQSAIKAIDKNIANKAGSGGASRLVTRMSQCFVAGTLIRTPNGLTPIEDVKVGDQVAARDEKTGQLSWKPVTKLFQNQNKRILKLTVSTPGGLQETYGVTLEHPFWVTGEGWVAAEDIKPGDQIGSIDRKKITVHSLQLANERQNTYNFEVADYHTYFVGELGSWVHNACGGYFKTSQEAAQKAAELGFKKIGATIKNQPVFRKGNIYIVRDIDGHRGGAWKMANSVKNLLRKKTRLGTYGPDLITRIGD